MLDDKLSPPAYKLRDPDEDFSNIFSRSISTYDLSQRENSDWNEAYASLIDLFISVLNEKSNSKSKGDGSTLHEIQLVSGVESLFNYASRLSPSGCLCVVRHFDGKNNCFSNSSRKFGPVFSMSSFSLSVCFSAASMNENERSF